MAKYYLGSTRCPTCDKKIKTEQGVRMHHTRTHDTRLDNRICDDCGKTFYDEKSQLNLCNSCVDGFRYSKTPEELTDEDWRTMSSYERWYYKNSDKEIKRVQKNRRKRRKYVVQKHLINAECERCGFNDPRAIEFHHTDRNKLDESLLEMSRNMRPKELIEKEITRGELLCANCHLINHHPNRFEKFK